MEIWKLSWYPNWEMKQLRHRTWVAVRSTHEDSSPAVSLQTSVNHQKVRKNTLHFFPSNTSNNLALSQLQDKSVSPLDGLRDIERPSLPSFLWHYAFDLKDGTAIGDFMRFEVLKLNLSRSRWSVTHQPGRYRCKTPLPGHNMHLLPLVHVALAPLHSRRH